MECTCSTATARLCCKRIGSPLPPQKVSSGFFNEVVVVSVQLNVFNTFLQLEMDFHTSSINFIFATKNHKQPFSFVCVSFTGDMITAKFTCSFVDCNRGVLSWVMTSIMVSNARKIILQGSVQLCVQQQSFSLFPSIM